MIEFIEISTGLLYTITYQESDMIIMWLFYDSWKEKWQISKEILHINNYILH